MPRIHWVTTTQVAAAKLVVRLSLEDGLEPDPVAVKMAQATPERRPRDANGKLLDYIDVPDDDTNTPAAS